MNREKYHRKISAIWSADVAGYSRLIGDDEEATVRTLTRYRQIMSDLIGQHRGRVVDSPGDNLLAEFASVVDALRCAWDVQQALAEKNGKLAADRRMHFRIGINLGDVIEDDGRLYGDAVNIAARIESLADHGGITISGAAYDQVKHKLPYQFEYTGEQAVKNIRDPVRTYKVIMHAPVPDGGIAGARQQPERKRPGWLLPLAAACLVIAAGIYYLAYRPARSRAIKPVEQHSVLQASPGTAIVVLPFKNLSGDPEQEYFSDGITNDIITELSRFHNLLVIASNTAFTYKGKIVDIKEIGRELQVDYALEGSVQKLGGGVRINAQLIDAASETHIWAERYERDYSDIFRLQGELVQAIVARLAIYTFRHEQDRAMRKKPQDLEAYDYLLRGWAQYQHRTRASNNLAGEMFAKAISYDQRYADAYVGLAWVDFAKSAYGWTEFPDKTLANAFKLGRKALELDAANASAHALLSNVYTLRNQYDLAIREAEQAIELNPNDATSYSQLGWALVWAGRIDEAVTALEMSLRLDSAFPRNAWLHLGMAYYLLGRYQEALDVLEKGVVKSPDFTGYHLILAATYARLGRQKEAARAADTLIRLDPFFKVESYGTAFRNPAHRAAIADGLRSAGLN